MNKEITISPRQIGKAIEDLLDEKELLQDKIYKMEERINKAIEYIESKNNGVCIVNGEEKDAYTFLLDFKKSREFVWRLLEILKDSKK